MALGKPIIASNIDGYASVVAHGVEGVLVPPKDSRMLTQALLSLMTDEKLRQQIGAKGKVKAKDYSWQQIARRIHNYYINVLEKSS